MTERFTQDASGLVALVGRSARWQCAFCQRYDVVAHGVRYGYGDGNTWQVRGHRFLCSRRHRKRGCGKSWTVLLATCVRRRRLGTSLLWGILTKAAPMRTLARAGDCTPRHGYRLRRLLGLHQGGLRQTLATVCAPPPCTREALAAVAAHLAAARRDRQRRAQG